MEYLDLSKVIDFKIIVGLQAAVYSRGIHPAVFACYKQYFNDNMDFFTAAIEILVESADIKKED